MRKGDVRHGRRAPRIAHPYSPRGALCMATVLRSSRPACGALVLLAIASAGIAIHSADAQQPAASTPPPFRPPALALEQPASNTSVPQDKPVILFRFAPGDSTDPVDARSFTVSVDGTDRTGLFQVARDMAWGPLAPVEQLASLATGAHSVVARVCSIRGACVDVRATVSVAAAINGALPSPSRARALMDLLLAFAKRLLSP
jgi:hypothetical protein